MGCLSVLAALLSLAIPASIARSSAVGAVVLIVVFAVAAVAVAYRRKRPGWYAPIAVVAVLYAALVITIHALR